MNRDNRRIWFYWLLLVATVLMMLAMLASCRTVYVPQPEYHEIHDTIVKKETVEKEVIKEVTVRDSVSFLVKGDTVRIERWHYERDHKYEKALQATIDSLTRLKRDSVPCPVTVEVEKVITKMDGFQKFFFWTGALASLLLIVFISIKIRNLI